MSAQRACACSRYYCPVPVAAFQRVHGILTQSQHSIQAASGRLGEQSKRTANRKHHRLHHRLHHVAYPKPMGTALAEELALPKQRSLVPHFDRFLHDALVGINLAHGCCGTEKSKASHLAGRSAT